MTTYFQPVNPLQLSRDEYITIFYRAFKKRFRGNQTYKGSEVEDVVSYAVVILCGNYEKVVIKHPCPINYSGLRFANIVTDFGRRQAAQRGEGARHTRVGKSLDAKHSSHDMARIHERQVYESTDQVDDALLVDEIMSSLPLFQQKVLRLCGLEGRTTIEAARTLGVTRETVSRAYNTAKRNANKTFGAAA